MMGPGIRYLYYGNPDTMVIENFSDLAAFVKRGYAVPEDFFAQANNEGGSCIFLVSCLSADRIIFIQDSIEIITGYPRENFTKGGMDFWFPLIHPEDLPQVMDKIIQSHKLLSEPGFEKTKQGALILEYRFKKQNGEWGKLKDTKYLLLDDDLIVDKILCKFELISPDVNEVSGVEDIFRKKKSCTKMLEFALVHKNAETKQPLNEISQAKTNNTASLPQLTKKEKEILLLIGEGLSTKMIADKCNISINTVETHRRHLLEKLGVKNSMELIKEASKIFWL